MVFVCKDCGKEFPSQSRFIDHTMVHRNIRVECGRADCDRTYSNHANLRRHNRSHHVPQDQKAHEAQQNSTKPTTQ